MIDNISIIKKFITPKSEDDFWHLQIIKRKKEHKDLGSNSYVVKTYYVRDIEYLERKYGEIKALCDYHNARACINLNRRSFEKTAYHTLKKITDCIMNKDFKSVRKSYESVCGQYSNEKESLWIIDIDSKEINDTFYCIDQIKKCQPNIGEDKSKIILPTKNGFHLITSPFNIKQANLQHKIHKNNPTILYIP